MFKNELTLEDLKRSVPSRHSSAVANQGLSAPTSRGFQIQVDTCRCPSSEDATGWVHQPQNLPLQRAQSMARQASSSLSRKACWQ